MGTSSTSNPLPTALEPMISEAWIVDNSNLPDPPEHVPDLAQEEGNMDMIDDASLLEESTGEMLKKDVKLEDLFNDVDDDEDDEFSGAGGSNPNNESSPPDGPL